MKNIVTHISPDLDAISSTWLLHRYMPGYAKARVLFVPAGETLNGTHPDKNPDIIHVDTGMGKFDHHQTDADTCAADLVYEYLVKNEHIEGRTADALFRIVDIVNDFDHFREVFFPEADSDIYDFLPVGLIEGYKSNSMSDDDTIVFGETVMDAYLKTMFSKLHAEQEIEKGLVFKSKWGSALALETENEEAARLAQKKGHLVVVRKSPRSGHLRVKAIPKPEIDLTPVYEALVEKDPAASWFLHASRHMVLNGSAKNPKSVPTSISLSKAVEIIKSVT